MRRSTKHSRFFSSLKQVEDRLASEARADPESKTPHVPLSSPIFLDYARPDAERTRPRPPHLEDSSAPPLNFLSISSCPEQEQAEEEGPSPPLPDEADADSVDDIERLMSLLGLPASEDCGGGGGSSCHCSGGEFYSRVAGVKGPKCGRERKRLDAWIEHYYNARKEPARLAHLLLAKAWCSSDDYDEEEDGDGLGRIEFPVTVEEFLQHDPPEDE